MLPDRMIEIEHPGVRLIDNASHGTWGRARIEGMHALGITMFNVTLAARITQLWRRGESQQLPQFTVSLFDLNSQHAH